MTQHLIEPHGGRLVNLTADENRTNQIKTASRDWPSWTLTERQLCDLELLINGAFSPLKGFMNKEDYENVCNKMRLADGTLWPIPITLDVTEEMAEKLEPASSLALRDPEGVMLAALYINDIWRPDKKTEAKKVFGTTNSEHPGAAYLMNKTNSCYLGGKIEAVQEPHHYDFIELRLTPAELRKKFAAMGWRKIIAFQTRNPMHRAHHELTIRATAEIEANLLIHPVVGPTKPGDIDYFTRVRCYQAMLSHYPKNTAMLNLLPLAMRMAGPREAVWHAIIRKNYGCTHLIVGRDHAGPGSDSSGKPFYGPYEAQELVGKYKDELHIEPVPFKMMVYIEEQDSYIPIDQVPKAVKTKTLSGTQLRQRLADGKEIPAWFSFPKVIRELHRSYPPRSKQGFTVFFTGLPSAGKSTLAKVLLSKLMEIGGRPMTLLDGDIVRRHLSSELGFSRKDRDTNIKRIGWVASEITKCGGVAICAPIAPYDLVRKEIRQMIEARGGFVLIYVSTPLQVCEQRDRKGLYAKARAGIVKEFTGISDPYEEPADADMVIDTIDLSSGEAVQSIILHLEKEGYISAEN